jgi:hypothetical protein
VELDRNRDVAIARINTLLDRQPDYPLPPPPAKLPGIEDLPLADELRLTAVANRPDLAAIAARLRAEQSALALANKDYLPDFEVMGRYDAFWQEPEQTARSAGRCRGFDPINLLPPLAVQFGDAIDPIAFPQGRVVALHRGPLDELHEALAVHAVDEKSRQSSTLPVKGAHAIGSRIAIHRQKLAGPK